MELLSLTYVAQKPSGCDKCVYKDTGQGFAPDHVPANPKIAFMAEAAGDTEMMLRGPLVGASGRMFFHRLLEPHGLTRDDVILSNVLRCHPPENAYPTGYFRKEAERFCRQYDRQQRLPLLDQSCVGLADGGLDSFNPNLVLVTIHPAFVSRTWSTLRVAQADIAKGIRLMNRGHRVLILLGDKATDLILPDLDGGILKWRGHYQAIDWAKVKDRIAQGDVAKIWKDGKLVPLDDDVPF